MKRLILILFFSNALFTYAQSNKENFKIDTIGQFIYTIKDTISTIVIHYEECTECLDAWVDSGTVFLPDSVIHKIRKLFDERGAGYIPNGQDLYLTGKHNIKKILFGDSTNYVNLWNNKYLVIGKAIDTKSYGIIFRVDKYIKLEDNK